MDDDDVFSLKKDILNLLGMKEVPSSSQNPHFIPHDGKAPSKVRKKMLNPHASIVVELE